MNKEIDNKSNEKPIRYYGKKAYRIHPLLARVKRVEAKTPDYRSQNMDCKNDCQS